MSRNKKILIGVGVVVVLGAIAFANVKFKRQDGLAVNVESIQKRDLQAIVALCRNFRQAIGNGGRMPLESDAQGHAG